MLMIQTWKVSTCLLAKTVAERLSEEIEDACQELGGVVSAFETDLEIEHWRLEIYFEDQLPDEGVLRRLLPETEFTSELLPQTDWVSHSQSALSPINAGRFFVHGEHDRHHRPAGGVSVEIQAGQAFGTGHHGTTRGCLLALEHFLRRQKPMNALDVGCGSALLAIAFAKIASWPVIASDIHPIAVRVARENARNNRSGTLVRTLVAIGTQHNEIRNSAPFDLVFANILASSLAAMKKELSQTVSEEGT